MLGEAPSLFFSYTHQTVHYRQRGHSGQGSGFLSPCGPGEVTAENVTSLVWNGLKGVVDRTGGEKEV